MSNRIKSCSPGTKVEYVLNDQAVLCSFKASEMSKFVEDENARSLNDTGVYIGYSTDTSVTQKTYSGESTTEDSGGVQNRIVEHLIKKQELTSFMVLMNATVDGHRRLEGNTFKLLEHIFRLQMKYANKSNILNIKRTGSSVSPDTYAKVICPLLIDIKYTIEGPLADLLTPVTDEPAKNSKSKMFIKNDESFTQVYLQDEIILKHSHFKFPQRKIKESNDCFTLLNNLINSNICVPYVYNGEVVIKFIQDTNINEAHIINTSDKRSFMINERLLVSLMGSPTDFKNSFKWK